MSRPRRPWSEVVALFLGAVVGVVGTWLALDALTRLLVDWLLGGG